MASFIYPHTLDNGAGERLTFARRLPTPRGDRLEGDNVVGPGGGPPMHVHHFQEEGLTVVAGRMGYQRPGEPPRYAEVGEAVVFAAGEPHRFWNAGADDLRCTAYIEPAGNIEFFLGSLFASQRANGGRRPGLFDAAYLTRRYRSEFGMLAVPAPVQRFVFPVVVALGRVLGRYAKYADAPAPLGRA